MHFVELVLRLEVVQLDISQHRVSDSPRQNTMFRNTRIFPLTSFTDQCVIST